MTPITMTDQAAGHIRSILDQAPEGTQGLRLNIKTTGCSGNSYHMELIKSGESLDGDDRFEQNGAVLYIPKIHSWMLFGMQVDYITDDLGSSRFEFSNPNESGRCGCGESFHVDAEELKRLQNQQQDPTSS